jgi:hypothetical protein
VMQHPVKQTGIFLFCMQDFFCRGFAARGKGCVRKVLDLVRGSGRLTIAQRFIAGDSRCAVISKSVTRTAEWVDSAHLSAVRFTD